jgi:repressor LexA
MAEPLTPTERRVYHYLLDFLSENTYQPSIREIGKRFRIKSTKTVSDILQSLAEKGFIERDPSRSRGVRLLGFAATARVQPIPVYNRINAAEPALLPENRQGFITVDRRFVPSEDVYALRIKGNGMEGRAIVDGDYVLVNPSARARDGEIVAARIGEDTTVKTLTHRGAAIVLEPAGAGDREITVGPQDNFAVLGVICGVFRPFFNGQRDEDSPDLEDAEVDGEEETATVGD